MDGESSAHNLRQQQLLFADYVRNPALTAPPGIETRRLRIYRELFFGNISQLLASSFPVIRSICSDEQWMALVSDFYACHRSETPLFPYVASEFVDYLINERSDATDYPFLTELAQYEWSEIALRHNEAKLLVAYSHPDSKQRKPRLSPLCLPMIFRFPVHRIGVNFLPETAPEELTYLLVYRDRDEKVGFIESTAATFRLLQLLQDDSVPDMDAVRIKMSQELLWIDRQALPSIINDLIQKLIKASVLF